MLEILGLCLDWLLGQPNLSPNQLTKYQLNTYREVKWVDMGR